MISANRCAAHFLAMAEASGPFVIHPGFRRDRTSEAQEFLKRYLPEIADAPIQTLAGYQRVFAALNGSHTLPLRGMVNRLLTRATFSTAPAEHMGMALPAYTNFTSPLRKYLDFLVHRQIKRLLAGEAADTVTDQQLEQGAAAIGSSRSATQAAERWLTANFLDKQRSEGRSQYRGEICHVTSAGFTVRLEDLGLEGQVDLRKDPEKFSFDKWTASLTSTTRRLQLGQEVAVIYQGCPEAGDGQLPVFELEPGCALKPPKN